VFVPVECMSRSLLAILSATIFSLFIPAALHAQDLREIRVTGARELSADTVREATHVQVGAPLSDPLERIAERIQARYREDGYTFAKAQAAFNADTGILSVDVDEGVIEEVEFEGVDDHLARRFADEFAMRAGDVFNRRRARQALDVLLQQTRGAIARERRPFDLVERGGRHVLVVGLREPPGRFNLSPDMGEREDWFTPVDGLVPSLGFGAAVFDHERFNHAFVAGHLSYKVGSQRGGFALGFERPLFDSPKLYVGGELHDLTATDDQWQISSTEASLASIGPRRGFRDYYRRRGAQIGGALRVHPQVEMLFAWRGERQEPLATTTDFSIWNGDESFRPNLAAQNGRLNAVILGASVDGSGFDRESLGTTYRRHQLGTFFGERLPADGHEPSTVWRVDWTSEISTPGALSSDFDFRRHIVSARAWTALSRWQEFGVRAIAGWSDGVLPPQRQFAIGGIGSVHGYEFKEAVGDSLQLLNLEYALGWHRGLKAFGFFDAGHATRTGALPESPWMKGVGWGIGVGEVRLDFGYRLDSVPNSVQVLLRFGRSF
jgi:POTRA domain-containing ShlB-type protein